MHYARVIHYNVQPAELLRTRIQCPLPMLHVGHIADEELRLVLRKAIGDFLSILWVDFEQQDLAPFLDKLPSNAFAQA